MVICAEYSSGVRLLCVPRLIPIPCSETLRSTVEVSPSKQAGVSWSAVWCRCVLVQFGHSLALMWLSVLLFQSESFPGLATRLLLKMPPRFCVQYAFFRHLKKRQFLHLFCVHVAIYFCVLCVVFCLLSALLLGSIVQFMHTLHSLFRGQLQLQFNTIQFRFTLRCLSPHLAACSPCPALLTPALNALVATLYV